MVGVVLKTLADGTTPDWEATVGAMLEIIGETGVDHRDFLFRVAKSKRMVEKNGMHRTGRDAWWLG